MPDTIGPVPFWLVKAVALALGAAFGSFANVLIHRQPLGESIVRPGSRCPGCGAAIRWYDNVPLLSYVLLLGRCRSCKTTISLRYPLVELCLAVLSLACLYLALARIGAPAALGGLAALWFFPFSFCFLLVVVTFIDLEHWRIPPVFTGTGTALAVASALTLGQLSGVGIWESLVGAALGALPIVILIEAWLRLAKREAMGYGDVMLLGMVGATLGYRSLPFVFLASSLQGLLVSVPFLLLGGKAVPPWERPEAGVEAGPPEPRRLRQAPVPFGPFIALAAIEWLFFGDVLWAALMP